jgi:hypothetical protein
MQSIGLVVQFQPLLAKVQHGDRDEHRAGDREQELEHLRFFLIFDLRVAI